ncbi:cupin [Streptomyces sp. CSDS2]|uniref:1,2-dihydroxy-3-keto-5-methylthiopentene dioxygenase n=1 Tax=Streptomyces sp. CSDS2 TaxID=3055051 RepID=UPI0025AFA365|nr:cupin [Streptomyces sp. CSDS2]MDN3258613.1 cupin [Streptomyces sp. CSDS2]
MTLLQIMPDDAPERVRLRTDDPERVRSALRPLGVRFERWETVNLPPDASDEDVMDAYRRQIGTVSEAGNYRIVDVARMKPAPDDPGWPEKAEKARRKFLEEHFHTEDEVRFFVDGAGCFYLHADRHVYATVCTRGDLISVPARTVHWFDMGTRPDFTAIRFFQKEDGWVGEFLADSVASRFPTLEQLLAAS